VGGGGDIYYFIVGVCLSGLRALTPATVNRPLSEQLEKLKSWLYCLKMI